MNTKSLTVDKKQLLVPLMLSIFCGTYFVARASMGESIALGTTAYNVGKYAYNTIFQPAENAEIIKKHLPKNSYLARACKEENMSQAYISLATHYRNLEEYHKIKTLKRELNKIDNIELKEIIEKSLQEAEQNKLHMNLPDDNGTYWESLSEEEKSEIKDSFKEIIEDNIYGIDNYAQELTYLYNSLNK